MNELGRQSSRVYSSNRSKLAHLSYRPQESWDRAACDGAWSRYGGWLGTGSQEEVDKAASLRLCPACAKRADMALET